ncbi:BTB/POZ domain-containing protein At3g49900-like isoform X1 [Coffea eugenioides]|uniref:BTB/POZ domain-containing protein At3g49900-like isoform X1 n=2 Tax=Coffea eugenioides TaxID=49369 RepID=UPI000F60E954|nr:BTB/POZ domain-containing protein At3g49900-like isoform X1 [Coffea eugenioides]XP_027179236.1 BTB/POZ domain-containing protein At3g49900-like isoform X1 [Coffea eugenioides]
MEALSLRVWKDLGVVDTIFEEEGEDPATTPSVSPLLSPSPTTPLHSLVEAWSLASGDEIDVVVHVEDSCFYLHKAPLRSRSGYMKRLLKEDSSELSLSPPLNITAETFSLVTEFCYGAHIVITPFNVAPLRIAAELLEMTEANGIPDDSLRQKTETYLRRAVAVNQEYATVVLRSAVSIFPEAETTACLVSRCIEALMSMHDGDDAGDMTCLNDVLKLGPDDFQLVVESLNQRLTTHDLLYRVLDLYLKGHVGKITEEQKTRMCNHIDCSILSSQVLMHAVQNPRMPLRFVVQAMFVEQLNTRRSIFSAADHRSRKNSNEASATLGAILQRDAALRQVAQLKAAMSTTNSRIQDLEKELNGMRKRFQESQNSQNSLDSGRSQSFRFSSENKIERGQVGSVSSASFRIMTSKDHRGAGSSSFDQESSDRSQSAEKKLGRRLMDGLKSALRVSSLVSKKKFESSGAGKFGGDGENVTEKCEIGKGDVIVIKKDLPYHR